MQRHRLQGQPPIELVLRRSARARRITLRVSQLDGRVTLTMPARASEAEALEFAHDKAGWIRTHLARQAGREQVGHGTELPLGGVAHRVVAGASRSVRQEGREIAVPGSPEDVGLRLSGWLKARARRDLSALANRYSSTLGRDYAGLSLRDTRSRWGSCSSAGRLMFSWRLIMAPEDVMAYVAAHEVAHLAEMNHSPAFWSVVQQLYGPYAAERRWLRENGAALHRYRFGD